MPDAAYRRSTFLMRINALAFRPADAADFAYLPARIIKLPGWIIKLPVACTDLAELGIELASSRRRVAGRSDRLDGEAAARHRPFQFGLDPLSSVPVGEGLSRVAGCFMSSAAGRHLR